MTKSKPGLAIPYTQAASLASLLVFSRSAANDGSIISNNPLTPPAPTHPESPSFHLPVEPRGRHADPDRGWRLARQGRIARPKIQLFFHVVDVVIEGATHVVKKVATAASQGAQKVMAVCTEMATNAFREARRTVSEATTAAATLCNWVTGWFNSRPGWGW